MRGWKWYFLKKISKNRFQPLHFQDAIKELKNEGKINFSNISLLRPDTSILSSKELQVIDDTINRISHCLSKEINEYLHGDIPWRIAKEGDAINYEAVFYRDPEYSVREYDDEI